MESSRQLSGLLATLEEAERILGPVGPKLAATSLHPRIWNAAVSLWPLGPAEALGVPAGRTPRALTENASRFVDWFTYGFTVNTQLVDLSSIAR
jgi:hypothetical protein